MRHDELFGDFDAMFVELAKRARTGRFEPNCDVYLNADETELVVEVEIAGADPSELRVGLEQRQLFIVGRRSHRRRARPGDVLMKEIEYGDFIKKIHLPVPVAHAEVTACVPGRHAHHPVAGVAGVPPARASHRTTNDRQEGFPSDMAARVEKKPPPEILGILPLQDAVLFPNTVIPLAVVKKPGIALVEEALREGKQIGLVALVDKDTENPGPDDVRRVGTVGTIQKMLKIPDGTLRCIVAGSSVFRIEDFTQVEPYLAASVREEPDVTVENEESVAMHRNLAGLFQKLLGFLPQAPREMEMEVNNITDSNLLTYFIASTMRLDTADRQEVLEERNTRKRMRKLTMLLTKELEVVELGHKIQSDIQREMEKNQREFYLRQQLRAIQDELGETDPQQAETNELRKKIDEAQMPEEVRKAADRELDRLSKVPHGVARVQRHPHLPRLARPVAVGQGDERRDRHSQGARDPRRGSLRPRESQGSHHRVSRRRQAQETS